MCFRAHGHVYSAHFGQRKSEEKIAGRGAGASSAAGVVELDRRGAHCRRDSRAREKNGRLAALAAAGCPILPRTRVAPRKENAGVAAVSHEPSREESARVERGRAWPGQDLGDSGQAAAQSKIQGRAGVHAWRRRLQPVRIRPRD